MSERMSKHNRERMWNNGPKWKSWTARDLTTESGRPVAGGEWVIDPNGERGMVLRMRNRMATVMYEGTDDLEISDSATGRAVQKFGPMLYAATDLVSALEACLRRLDIIGAEFPESVDGVTGMVMEDARNAIAKARERGCDQ